MTRSCDCAIIGGGHNALVCAAYLARAGRRVIVLEQRAVLGGAAVTEEFHPGFRNSTCSYTLSLLHPKIIAELDLKAHGLNIVRRRVNNIFPHPADTGGPRGIAFPNDRAEKTREFARFSPADAAALPRFEADIDRAAAALKQLLLETPPNAGGGLRDLMRLVRLGWGLGRQSLEDQRLLLTLATLSAAEFLARYFDNDRICASYAFDGIVGTYASPYTPGTAYVLLHHAFGEASGEPGIWGHAIGGMGAVSDAIAAAARTAGAELCTHSPVAGVLTEGRRVKGVKLESGAEIRARTVIAGVTPHLLFSKLLPGDALPADTQKAFTSAHYGSATFRMNVALADLPVFPGFEDWPEALTGGIVLAPTMDWLDSAYTSARRQGMSEQPIIEMLIPSTLDASLAPEGQHVASLFCQHFPYDTFTASPAAKARAVEQILATVEGFAPGFRSLILGYSALSAVDLESEFGLTKGDIFHGSLSLGQLFSARPILGHAAYAMPLRGLYLCGSGAHPGGGVTGVPGHNCAREVLRNG